MIRALQIDAEVDLRAYLQLLQRNGIRYRVSEESGHQVVWVIDEAQAQAARILLDEWRASGEVAPVQETVALVSGSDLLRRLLAAFMRAPVTVIMIILCLVVAALSAGGNRAQFVVPLFYPPFSLNGSLPLLSLVGQLDSPVTALRTLTPALLHFGMIHLVFNTLWLWYLGSMIEAMQSSWRYLGLILFAAFAGNTAQYFTSYSVNFGGMSGVVYGLVGYIWIWQTLCRSSRLRLPPSMIGFFLLALVLMEVFASSWIATAAHVGGLVSGMLVAAIVAIYEKVRTA